MLNIVVIEDEFTIRNGLCHLIPKLDENYRVVGSAEDGYEGLQLIKRQKPDIAICDIQMKKLTGLEMIRQLNDADINCKYIILSGYSEFVYAQTAISLRVMGYLLKPIIPAELAELLARAEAELSGQNSEHITPIVSDEPQGYSSLILSAIEKISTGYQKEITLSTTARSLGVTPEYLSSRFTLETGENFMIYLRNYRIQKACELLQNTDKKMYEIAFMVGYDNPQYFSSVFKSVMGISPKSYMRDHHHNRKQN